MKLKSLYRVHGKFLKDITGVVYLDAIFTSNRDGLDLAKWHKIIRLKKMILGE